MIGIVWEAGVEDGRFAPSTPAALYPVAGTPVAAHTAAAVAAVAEEVVVFATDPAVRRAVSTIDAAVRTPAPAAFEAAWERISPGDEQGVRDSHAVEQGVTDSHAVEQGGTDSHAVEQGDTDSHALEQGGTDGRTADDDRVLCVGASTYVEAQALETIVEEIPTVAIGRSSGGPESDGLGDTRRVHAVSRARLAGVRSIDDLAAELDAVNGERRTVECEHCYDVRRPWELLGATERALDGIGRRLAGEVHPSAECRGDVVVQPGASVGPGVVVEGPAMIDANATVGPNAYVRGATYLGADVRVGHGVEVKNSVACSGAALPHLTYVGDSVVGPDANLGAGTVVANLRHDERPIAVTHGDERVSTGRRKFGVVVGAGARVGIDSTLNAGVTIPAGASTLPGATLLEDPDAGDAEP